jgi:hypothetical protein
MSFTGEIDQRLHAHRLDDVDLLLEIVLVGFAVRTSLHDVLGPEAQHQVRLADEGLVAAGALAGTGKASVPFSLTFRAPAACSIWQGMKFMAGEPMKPATNLVVGEW